MEKIETKLSVSNQLSVRMKSPIVFMPNTGGLPAYGYEATVLIDLCVRRRCGPGTRQSNRGSQRREEIGYSPKPDPEYEVPRWLWLSYLASRWLFKNFWERLNQHLWHLERKGKL